MTMETSTTIGRAAPSYERQQAKLFPYPVYPKNKFSIEVQNRLLSKPKKTTIIYKELPLSKPNACRILGGLRSMAGILQKPDGTMHMFYANDPTLEGISNTFTQMQGCAGFLVDFTLSEGLKPLTQNGLKIPESITVYTPRELGVDQYEICVFGNHREATACVGTKGAIENPSTSPELPIYQWTYDISPVNRRY